MDVFWRAVLAVLWIGSGYAADQDSDNMAKDSCQWLHLCGNRYCIVSPKCVSIEKKGTNDDRNECLI